MAAGSSTSPAASNGVSTKASCLTLLGILTCCAIFGVAVWLLLDRRETDPSVAVVSPSKDSSSSSHTSIFLVPTSSSPLVPTVRTRMPIGSTAESLTPTPSSTNFTTAVPMPKPTMLSSAAPTPKSTVLSSAAPTPTPTTTPTVQPTGRPDTQEPTATKVQVESKAPITSSLTQQPSQATQTPAQVPPIFTRGDLIALIDEILPSFDPSSANSSRALDSVEVDMVSMNWFESNDSLDRAVQRFALACFWFSTNGPAGGWRCDADDTWMTNQTECSWEGVSCDTSDRVVALTHSSPFDTRLKGILPPELGLLSSLTDLDLRVTSITGTIPVEIGLLTGLTSIDISHDYTSDLPGRLTGQLPRELFRSTGLRRVNFERNSIEGTLPTEIGLLSNLESLILLQNQVVGTIPTELGLCTNMRSLGLGDNLFTGRIPSEILFRDIAYIALYGTALSGSIPCDVFTKVEIDCDSVDCPGGCCCQGFDDESCSFTC